MLPLKAEDAAIPASAQADLALRALEKTAVWRSAPTDRFDSDTRHRGKMLSIGMKRLMHEMQDMGYTWFNIQHKDGGWQLIVRERINTEEGFHGLYYVTTLLGLFDGLCTDTYCKIRRFDRILPGTYFIPGSEVA